jgi:hypothetical protein
MMNSSVNSDDSFDNLTDEELVRKFDEEINQNPIMQACNDVSIDTTDGQPVTYWEERCAYAEGAIERLFSLLSHYVPASAKDCMSVINQWNHLRGEIHAEYFGGPDDAQ